MIQKLCILAILAISSAQAVIIGQVDTFEDGTTLGWFVPGTSTVPPTNQSTGGPAGAGDNFLLLTATGQEGPGGRLAVLNDSQWTGNFLTAGVSVIRMDVRNFGPSDVYLRLLFEDFEGAGPPVNLALTTTAVLVPANSGWVGVSFALAPSNLTTLIGTATGALSDVDTIRIFHNPNPTFPGPGVGIPTVAASLGVDNITAIPEPPALSLLIAGAVCIAVGRWRPNRSV